MKKKIIREFGALLCSVAFWLVIILAAIPNAKKFDKKHVVKSNETQKDFVCVYLENEDVEKAEEKEEVVLHGKQKEVKKENLGEFVLTAYCSCEKCCGKWALNRPKDGNGNDIVYGASGAVLIEGVSVAVDPSVIPYGSKVYFSGKEYVAHDCGGAIKGNRIDLYFNDHLKALEFGRQKANVEVLYE